MKWVKEMGDAYGEVKASRTRYEVRAMMIRNTESLLEISFWVYVCVVRA